MTNASHRQRRRADVNRRAAETETYLNRCTVWECQNLTRAKAGTGLDRRHCRKHADHLSRHGDPIKPTYSATKLNPFRRTAFDYITTNADEFLVKYAVMGVQGLYDRAGPLVEAIRLRGLSPRDRANALWSRLRATGVDPRIPLAAYLAVEMIHSEDPEPARSRGGRQYVRVQSAKVVHRMASGFQKEWHQEQSGGGFKVKRLEAYPASSGRVLRHVGRDIELAGELVVDRHLRDLLAHKADLEEAGKLAKRAHPGRGVGVKKRPKREIPRPVVAAAASEVRLSSTEGRDRGSGTVRRDF